MGAERIDINTDQEADFDYKKVSVSRFTLDGRKEELEKIKNKLGKNKWEFIEANLESFTESHALFRRHKSDSTVFRKVMEKRGQIILLLLVVGFFKFAFYLSDQEVSRVNKNPKESLNKAYASFKRNDWESARRLFWALDEGNNLSGKDKESYDFVRRMHGFEDIQGVKYVSFLDDTSTVVIEIKEEHLGDTGLLVDSFHIKASDLILDLAENPLIIKKFVIIGKSDVVNKYGEKFEGELFRVEGSVQEAKRIVPANLSYKGIIRVFRTHYDPIISAYQ